MTKKSVTVLKGNGYTMTISTKRKIAVVVLTTVALSLGTVGVANASQAKPKSEAAKAKHEANHQVREALVVSIIGIDAASIKSRLKAGETLGAIAGAKKSALITALVAEATKNIDAAVTADKMSSAKATTLKAGVTAHVTAEVDAVRGAKAPGVGKGGPRHGMGKNH